MRQAAEDLDIASWVFTRSRSVGFATGVRPTAIDGAGELCAPMVAVGDTVLQSATSIADPGFFDELVDLLPARGTIAIDRWTVSSRARLAQLRPELRIVDAAGLLDRAKRTLDPAEVAVMADALHRTEASFLASIRGAAGRTERDLAGIFHAEAAARGLGLQAEPVFSAHSVTRDAAPWLRGSWADAPPYRGRTTEPGC